MHGYNFTERVRWALGLAREEAARLHHPYVGTEHVLLGLLRQDSSVALSVIESFGVAPGELRARVEQLAGRGRDDFEARTDLPYDSRAKKALELAMAEARRLDHAYVGTQHLLLGLIREENGIATAALVEYGLTLDATRQRTLEVLDAGKQDDDGIRGHDASIAASRAWARKRASSVAGSEFASRSLAASVIEALATHSDVAAVFSAQGIDIAKLTAALRAVSRPAPLGDAPSSSAGDSPPETSPPAA